MTRSTRCTCSACGDIGHTVGMCRSPAAPDYWRAAAQRHRAKAEEHAGLAHVCPAADVAYHRRAALLEQHDAERADRRAGTLARRVVVAQVVR